MCEILKWHNNGESEREGQWGGKKGETKGSQPKWQLKLHLSVESSVKTGSHLAKLERDQPKVLEHRQREIDRERGREKEREGTEGLAVAVLCVLRPIKKPLKSIPLEQNCTEQQIKAVAQISEQTERERGRRK